MTTTRVDTPFIDDGTHYGLDVCGGTPSAGGSLIRRRMGRTAAWAAANPILIYGEEGIDVDLGITKIGDGATTWTALPIAGSEAFTAALTTDAISTANTGTLTAGHIARVNATTQDKARTLPAAASTLPGTPVVVRKTDTTTFRVDVSPAGADTIDGSTAVRSLLYPGESLTLVSDGVSAWTSTADVIPTAALAEVFVQGRDVSTQARNFMRRLRTGASPVGMLVQGDETGDAAAEWVYLTAAWLAARYPAYTVPYRLWSDARQAYALPTLVQTGTAGLRRYVDPGDGVGTNRILTIADSVATSIVGDIDVQVHVNLSGGGFTVAGILAGKRGAAGNVSWQIEVGTDDTMTLTWSENGTDLLTATSTVALTGTLLTDDVWVRATLDVDNGAAGHDSKFWTSTDAAAWTQLGDTVTVAGVTSIHNGTAATQTPGVNSAVLGNVGTTVDILGLRVFPDLAGLAPVVDIDLGDYDGTATSFVDALGNTVTVTGSTGTLSGAYNLAVFNASTLSQAVTYSSDGTRFTQQTPSTIHLAFVNYSHNDASTGSTYRTAFKALTDLLLAKWPDIGIVAVSQNPEVAPRTAAQIAAHKNRQMVIFDYAASQGFATVDAFGEFTREDPTGATLVAADGAGVTAAGGAAWYALVRRLLTVADAP